MPSPSYYVPARQSMHDQRLSADVCVYGANAAGIIAAVHAAALGLKVILLNPGTHLGGMTAGGLGFTDIGNKAAIGGLARTFYQRVGRHYGKEIEWCFEPHIATKVFNELLNESRVTPLHGQYVAEANWVTDDQGTRRLTTLTTTVGLQVAASYFIDCSYEGDLMAKAGVAYSVGREATGLWGENYAGQQIHHTHQFDRIVDAYVRPGDPASGVLVGIDADSSFFPGGADRRIQAYNFRVCMTRRPDIRIPFPKPADFRRSDYELLARYLAAGGGTDVFGKFDTIQGGKTDTNNQGAVSTDFIGGSWRWPEASYEEREKIFQAHVNYQQGYHWFMANDDAVPLALRAEYAAWGLAGDEFSTNANWPTQLYIREARRMVGALVMTEPYCLGHRAVDDVVGLGAYGMDSHHCRRIVHNGTVLNEGDVQIQLPKPYPISYRAIVPKRSECVNLAVPVCASATHIAYGSMRMEPVFMCLAQSATTAVFLANLAGKAPLQDVPYAALRTQLVREGQVLAWDGSEANLVGGNAPFDEKAPVPGCSITPSLA